MAKETLEKLLSQIKKDGFAQSAIVSDEQMARLGEAFNAQKGVIATPPDELRYIEGLTDLPFGYIKAFKVIPAPGHEKCACGRIPSALEIVNTALKRKIHDKTLIRDVLIGMTNIVELAQTGRQGECIACGRTIVMRGYFKKGDMYA